MFKRRVWLAFALTAIVCGCGKQSAPVSDPAAPSTPSTAAPANRIAPSKSETATQPETTRTARLNEDGSETIEENTGDTGAHNPLLAAVASSAAAATLPATSSKWQEGVNYTRLVPAQPTSAAPDQVEVVEVFWYGCPHCYAIDPQIEAWRKHKASYIKFVRVPVMWDDEVHRSHARLFYALEALGKLDQLHSVVFKEIHVNGNALASNDPAASEQMQMAFLEKNGVSEADFKKAYHSFSVETSLQRAAELTVRYRVDGVPKFIINGKYITDVGMAQGPEGVLELVDYLAAQDHKH